MSTILCVKGPRRRSLMAFAIAFSLAAVPAVQAQEMDHSKMDHSKMPMPAPAKPAPAKKKKTAAKPPAKPKPAPATVKRSAEKVVDHAAMGHEMPAPAQPSEPIPVVTQADRDAAFPAVHGHAAHDRAIHSFWLLDRLEVSDAGGESAVGWEGLAWVGGDIHRLWLRSEGELESGALESADLEVLYGRSISPWWDLVAGVRHDFGEGPSHTFAAIGLMGLSPYKFEIGATAYIGQSGQTAMRLEAEYDTLLTNRLILQWQAEVELFGKADPLRRVGSGLSTAEAGLRLRYEVTRQFAPYVGVVWERAFGQTADYRQGEGEDTSDTRVVAGFRIWF